MNPDNRQPQSTPFSRLHEDESFVTPWTQIKKGVQRLTGQEPPADHARTPEERAHHDAQRDAYQHTAHFRVDPLPIHVYEERTNPAPPRPFAPAEADYAEADYVEADYAQADYDAYVEPARDFAPPGWDDEGGRDTHKPAPTPPPYDRVYPDGDVREDRSHESRPTVRHEENAPASESLPTFSPRIGGYQESGDTQEPGLTPSSFDRDYSGGDVREDRSHESRSTVHPEDDAAGSGSLAPFDPSDWQDGSAKPPHDFAPPYSPPNRPIRIEESPLDSSAPASFDPSDWEDDLRKPPHDVASAFDPRDWSDEAAEDSAPAPSSAQTHEEDAYRSEFYDPEPRLHIDPLHRPSLPTRHNADDIEAAGRFDAAPEAKDDADCQRSTDAFQPGGDGMRSPESTDAEPAEPTEERRVAPVVDHAGNVFSPLDLRDRVVIMLLFKQTVSVEQVQETWVAWRREQRSGSKEMLWRAVAKRDDVDREQVFAEAAEVYAFETYSLNVDVALEVIDGLRKKRKFTETDWQTMRGLGVLPVNVQQVDGQTRYVFGAFDPSNTQVQQFTRHLKIGIVELVYVPESSINALVIDAFAPRNEYLERINDDSLAYDLGLSHDQEGLVDDEALDAEINRSTLINLFEATLVEAVRQGASDIHIFPNAQNRIEIHMRLNGELDCWHVEERVHPEAFLAVVKDNAINIDRFERDMGQDGFLQRKIDDTLIRFRVSVMPLMSANHELRAESIVMRVLDDRKVVTDLQRLGFQDIALRQFNEAISKPHGMVILTGPTGSGKTTTLYAALQQVVTPKKNVLTVEDPVEYVLPGVRQLKLTHKFGLEEALRSILRHDPDIVMVGEMRDRPTAELAIKLANTGHLTFSTLHTNDAPSAVSRLYKMGIEPFLIAYAVNLVAAQRLVRKLCPDCRRRQTDLEPEYLSYLGFDPHEPTTFYEPGHNPSCKRCKGTGFVGRRAVTETMPFTREIRQIIIDAKGEIDEDALRDAAIRGGMLTLRDSAREFVRMGETSLDEMHRATASDG